MSTSELSAERFSPEFWSSDAFSSAPEPPREASLSSIASCSSLFTDSSARSTGRLALSDLLAGAAGACEELLEVWASLVWEAPGAAIADHALHGCTLQTIDLRAAQLQAIAMLSSEIPRYSPQKHDL